MGGFASKAYVPSISGFSQSTTPAPMFSVWPHAVIGMIMVVLYDEGEVESCFVAKRAGGEVGTDQLSAPNT
jgi:hypothetical protein